jgi:hypothetical protein
VTRRLAVLALAAYPLAFRRRYGGEMRAWLDEAAPRPRDVVDLLSAALVAHLRPPGTTAGLVSAAERVRASTSGVLACWVGFVAAGFAFYKTTEDAPFASAANAHGLLGAAHRSVQIFAVLGSGAVVIGALPLVATALGAARREPRLRVLVSIPFVAASLFAAFTALLVWVAHTQSSGHASGAARAVFIAWTLAGVACGGACVAASRRVLFTVHVTRARLVVAYACSTLVTAAMVTMTIAVGLYTVALTLDAARLASQPNGPLQLVSTGISLVLQLVAMALAATLAATTTRRGWPAAATLKATA